MPLDCSIGDNARLDVKRVDSSTPENSENDKIVGQANGKMNETEMVNQFF